MKNYLKTQFDPKKLMDVFDELPLWSAPFGLKLLDTIDYKLNITALDIGFGTGFPLTEVAMRLGDTSTVYGIDPWYEAIQRTNQKLDYYDIHNVQIIEGIGENIPLADNTVDLITSNNGLNNTSDIEQVMRECSRIMRSGGQFVQTMNLDKSMFEFYSALETVLSAKGLTDVLSNMKLHIEEKRPSLDYMQRLVEKSGFTIRNMEQHQFNYQFANGTTLLNHYFIRLAFMDSWIDLLPEDQIKSIFSDVESLLNKQAELLGNIKLSIPFVVIDAIKK